MISFWTGLLQASNVCRELIKYGCKKAFSERCKYLTPDLNAQNCVDVLGNVLFDITKATTTYEVENKMKNLLNTSFLYSEILSKYEKIQIWLCPYRGKWGYDSAQIREHMNTILSRYGKIWIRESPYSGII